VAYSQRQEGSGIMLDYLRQFNMPSVLLRLTLAVLCGGVIGINREHKRRPAGFRTYMLVCLGAAMTGVLSQYLWVMINTQWAEASALLGKKVDVSRIGAKAIGGVGFLGAGTILITDQSEVKGLTTAAGLWASACLGLAIGGGFYEGALAGFLAIFLSIKVLPWFEDFLLSRSRNMNLYVELERKGHSGGGASVVFYLQLPRSQSHAKVLACLAYSPDVRVIDEI